MNAKRHLKNNFGADIVAASTAPCSASTALLRATMLGTCRGEAFMALDADWKEGPALDFVNAFSAVQEIALNMAEATVYGPERACETQSDARSRNDAVAASIFDAVGGAVSRDEAKLLYKVVAATDAAARRFLLVDRHYFTACPSPDWQTLDISVLRAVRKAIGRMEKAARRVKYWAPGSAGDMESARSLSR